MMGNAVWTAVLLFLLGVGVGRISASTRTPLMKVATTVGLFCVAFVVWIIGSQLLLRGGI